MVRAHRTGTGHSPRRSPPSSPIGMRRTRGRRGRRTGRGRHRRAEGREPARRLHQRRRRLVGHRARGVRAWSSATPPAQPADLFDVLADAGITDVRVRVWNDPFDADGNGYGGGTVDVARAVEIGERATAAGLGVLVDFHYSDFWADPAKQKAPKAWAGAHRRREGGRASTDVHARTRCEQMRRRRRRRAHGAGRQRDEQRRRRRHRLAPAWRRSSRRDPPPCARSSPTRSSPCTSPTPSPPAATPAYAAEPRRRTASTTTCSRRATTRTGTARSANLTAVLKHVADTYGKKVMVAETSWAYTLEDGDGHGNVDRPAVRGDAVPGERAGPGHGGARRHPGRRERRRRRASASSTGSPRGCRSARRPSSPRTSSCGSATARAGRSSFAGEYDPDDAGVVVRRLGVGQPGAVRARRHAARVAQRVRVRPHRRGRAARGDGCRTVPP